jgi:hypothetical protein
MDNIIVRIGAWEFSGFVAIALIVAPLALAGVLACLLPRSTRLKSVLIFVLSFPALLASATLLVLIVSFQVFGIALID